MSKKTIVGYQVRDKRNDGIRYASFFLAACKDQCPYGCAVWSVRQKTYGIKLRFFWMSPFKKVGYDKYCNVINFFHLHIGWEPIKGQVLVEIVYEPTEETMRGE